MLFNVNIPNVIVLAFFKNSHDLSWPIGEAFLFGINELMKWSTRFAKPILFLSFVSITIAVPAHGDIF